MSFIQFHGAVNSYGWGGCVSNSAVSRFNRWREANHVMSCSVVKAEENDIIVQYRTRDDVIKLSTIIEEGRYLLDRKFSKLIHIDTNIDVSYMVSNFQAFQQLGILTKITLCNGVFTRSTNAEGMSRMKEKHELDTSQECIVDLCYASHVIAAGYLPEYFEDKVDRSNSLVSNTRFNIKDIDGKKISAVIAYNENNDENKNIFIDIETGADLSFIIRSWDPFRDLDRSYGKRITPPNMIFETIEYTLTYVDKLGTFIIGDTETIAAWELIKPEYI